MKLVKSKTQRMSDERNQFQEYSRFLFKASRLRSGPESLVYDGETIDLAQSGGVEECISIS
jgi:hypothetical protein